MFELGEIKTAPELGKKGSNNKYVWSCCQDCKKFRWVGFYHLKKKGVGNYCLCAKCAGLKNINLGQFKKGKDHLNWKGGIWKQGGYVFVKIQNKNEYSVMAKAYGSSKEKRGQRKHLYVTEHRLVLAEKLKRPLTKDEVVHHLNGIKDDNRLENLALVCPKTHDTKSYIKQLQKRILKLEGELHDGK